MAWAQAVAEAEVAVAVAVVGLAAAATVCRFPPLTRGRAPTCCGGTGEEITRSGDGGGAFNVHVLCLA